MNKRLKLILSLIALALLLTGCSTSTELITLDTTFSEAMNDGFLSAIITYPLSQAINWLTPKIGIFMAVTVVTIVLNAIVLAFTFKSNIAMQKMQEIQPELQKIQAKYEGRSDEMSQQRMAMEMQQLYNKYGINPLGSLASTFIQFPLLIGMYNAVRRSYAVANATFMGASLSLSPSQAIPAGKWVCVVIFVLMVACQFISIKIPQWIAEKRGKEEADKHHKTYKKPEQQNQAMTYGMLAMVAVAMFSIPTAVSLYYCISSIVNIAKTVVIDKMTHKEA
ncbi:MAG: membrane protein insertase YidC [Erysipelotrichaceae bacterium]|nr:membrane protein insertase YidC [Erysipelotrichaceae bacterium]MBQ6217920.1 membrane protein insertase YidC [Erysipelotrichaceae bacterium]